MVELSSKFGALPGEAVDLIAFAHNNNLVVEGLSFHVGSQCTNPQNYIQALNLAAGIFAEATSRGFELKLLDIGGGFPAHYDDTVPAFQKLARSINAELGRLSVVFASRPEVLAHNIETVRRIFREIRPGFRYDRSLEVLRQARDAGLVTKSNLILGLGEEDHEVRQAMADLRAVGCELLTVTQYLRPSPRHHPVARWVRPEEFVAWREEALSLGFAGVMSGPLVRSSYRAGKLYASAMAHRTDQSAAPVSS